MAVVCRAFPKREVRESAQIPRLASYKYPVLKLPNEIVSEIFIHFLPTYPDCPPPTGPLSPTRLTQVCRAWREISLGTPSLWRAISLSDEDLPLARQAQEVDEWVGRSGARPMAIEVDFVDSEFTSDEILDLLSSIVSHRTRLEHLKLRSDGPESLRALSGPMPRLRHLDLFFQYEFRESAVLVFSEAPLLRTVILTYTAKMVALPWAQLTSLTLRYLYPSECSPVLKQTTNLAFCHLLLFDEDDLTPTPVVVLPSLTSLKLEEDPIPDYLHTFNVPSLRCLEITEGFLGPNPVQSLASFISRSGCNLQQLIMREKHSILRSAYRGAFPSISFSFIADGED